MHIILCCISIVSHDRLACRWSDWPDSRRFSLANAAEEASQSVKRLGQMDRTTVAVTNKHISIAMLA